LDHPKIKEKDVGTSLLYLIGSNICHCFCKSDELKVLQRKLGQSNDRTLLQLLFLLGIVAALFA
jgi:hypothetical protein